MATDSYDMLLAGVGGQGIIFAGQIIMNSALRQGNRLYGFEEHGMARRGGAVATHIRFGKDIYTPLVPVRRGKLMAAFEPSESLRHIKFLGPGATVILNRAPVIPVSVSAGEGSYPDIEEIIEVMKKQGHEVISFNATSLAREAGNPIAMNVVMLGAICASRASPLKQEIVMEVIEERTPSFLRDINIDAFEKGYVEIEKE